MQAQWAIKEEGCNSILAEWHTLIHTFSVQFPRTLLRQLLNEDFLSPQEAYGFSSTRSTILFVFTQSNIPGVNATKITNSPLSPQKFQASHVASSAGSPYHLYRSLTPNQLKSGGPWLAIYGPSTYSISSQQQIHLLLAPSTPYPICYHCLREQVPVALK